MASADGESGARTDRALQPRLQPHAERRRRIPIAIMLALLVAAAMAPLVAFGAFGINRLVSSVRDQELERLSIAARSVSSAIDRELRGYRETAEVFAQSHHLQRGDIATFAAAAYEAVDAAGGHFALVDDTLRQLLNTQAPRGATLPAARASDALRQVFATGRAAVGDLEVDNLTGRTEFAIGVPVGVDGRVRYVLLIVPRDDLMSRLVAEQQMGRFGWYASVLDRNHRIVARSARHEELFGRAASPGFAAQLVGSEGRVTSVDLEGRRAITAFYQSPATGWRAVVWAPEDVILAPARDAERLVWGFAILAIALSLACAAAAARLIRGPLQRTVAAARALAASMPVRFAPSRLREADEIGRVLHDASAAIRAREAALAASETRLRLAQEIAEIGVIDWDVDADTAAASDGILRIYGEEARAWSRGGAYRGFMSMIHPEDRARLAAEHARLQRSGGRFAGDFRILRRGETRWLSATGMYTRERDGAARLLAVNVDITERKRIEIGLRDRDETLHLALDAAYAIAFTWDIADDVVRRLHSSEPMLPANENHPGRLADVTAVVHPEDRALFRAAIDAALAERGGAYRSRFRIRRHDGEVRWLEEWGRVERAPDGTPLRLVGISIDVTERRRVEAELAARLAELESLYGAAPIGLALFDRELRFLRVNEALARINGLPIAAHLGRRLWELLPDLRTRLEPLFRRVLAGDATIEETEVAGETPALPGALRHWSVKIYPLRSPRDEIDGVGAMVEEITARKHAEAQMARYAAIVVATHDALIGLDEQGRIDAWNPGAERLFGWTAAEVLGRAGDFLGTDGATPTPTDITRRVLAGESIGPLDVLRMRKSGTPIEVSLTATPVRRADGVVIGVAAAAHDISERRRREAQMRFVMRELTHRSKNLLAVIQAMARQTARSSSDAGAFIDRFADRLAALARSHDLLVGQDWTGAELHALVRQQLAPFVDQDDGRVSASGPRVVLKPEVAQSVGMALHELATNASKYGALSVPGGRVAVAWRREATQDGGSLALEWRESGGPRIAPPTRHGFGRSVIERMVAASARGEAQIEWLPEGLCWRLRVPASSIVEDDAH